MRRLWLITDAKQSKMGQNWPELSVQKRLFVFIRLLTQLVIILIHSEQRDNLSLDKCLVILFFMVRGQTVATFCKR